MSGYWLKSLCSKGGWVTFSTNFRWNVASESVGYHVALFVSF